MRYSDLGSRELRDAVRQAKGNGTSAATHCSSAELITQCAADVPIESIKWLWPGRVAIGKQTLIAGEAGLGKSQLSIAMVAAVTTASAWPCGEGRAPVGSAIILSAEDDPADTVVPRLMAAGADLRRVHLLTAVRVDGSKGRRTFDLGVDIELLAQKLSAIGDVRLIIIDPISSYLGTKVDSHINAAVRGVLEPVGELAARLRVAVVSITHPPKSTGAAAINRFIGSVAFVAAARTAFMVVRDVDDEDRRLFLPVKNNLGPLGKGLAFRLEQRIVGEAGKGIVASSVAWESEPVTIAADQALQAADAQAGGDHSAASEAEEFLQRVLAGGPVAAAEIKREAQDAGLSWATVRRAQGRLGIRPVRRAESGDGLAAHGRWFWSLPESVRPKVLTEPLTCSSPDMSTLGGDEHLRRHRHAPGDYPELPDSLQCPASGESTQVNGRAPALGPVGDSLDDFR
jgi:putative DNA primase/helicase